VARALGQSLVVAALDDGSNTDPSTEGLLVTSTDYFDPRPDTTGLVGYDVPVGCSDGGMFSP